MTVSAILAERRLPFERSFPTRSVVTLGLPSSGTRLVHRLLQGSKLLSLHDGRHGTRGRWDTERVVIVTRDERARADSAKARWGDQQPAAGQTIDNLRSEYPDAFEVAYEDVVADKDAVIARLAEWLGRPPWTFDEDVYDGNAYKGTRENR